MGDYKHWISNKPLPGIGTIRGSGGYSFRRPVPPLQRQQHSKEIAAMTNFISPETVDRVEQIILDHFTTDQYGSYRLRAADAADAILAEYPLMIARAELPEVEDDPVDSYFTAGGLRVQNDEDPGMCRFAGLSYLVAAEHLEQRGSQEAEREKRQNELAQEFDNSSCDARLVSYAGSPASTRSAIDRIMLLEDGTP